CGEQVVVSYAKSYRGPRTSRNRPAGRLDSRGPGRHSEYMAADDWRRLGQYVRAGRLAAGHEYVKDDWDRVVGAHYRTLNNLEKGKRVSPNTVSKVELALGWKPGSADRVLAGGEPIYADEAMRTTMSNLDPKVRSALVQMPAEVREAFLTVYQ